jgi:hypothetical protein
MNFLAKILTFRGTSNWIVRYLATKPSHYDILGVTPSANKKEIKEAYINKSKVDNDLI